MWFIKASLIKFIQEFIVVVGGGILVVGGGILVVGGGISYIRWEVF